MHMVTDHTILRKVGNFDVHVPSGVYAIRDKVNSLNSQIRTADGTIRLFVHPRCRNLIRSLRGLVYQEGTNLPDPNSQFGHLCDALGYLVIGEFKPLKRWSVGGSDFLVY